MYTCEFFAIHELVPKSVFEQRGESAWEFLDERLLRSLDLLRDRFGHMTVNNYFWGEEREWSGLRTPESPFYSPFSQHTFGRAADCLFAEVAAVEVRQFILARPNDPAYRFISAIELDTDWLHFDVRNTERIKTFRP